MCNHHYCAPILSKFGVILFLMTITMLIVPSTALAQTAPPFFRLGRVQPIKDAPPKTFILSTSAVRDTDTPFSQLTVSQLSVYSSGVIFTNLRVDPNTGFILGDVQADCTVSTLSGNFFLRVQDPEGNFTTGVGQISVQLAQASYPSAAPVSQNSSRVILPNLLTDTGVRNFTVTSPTFTGNLSINQTTGIITLGRARPVGTHILNVTASVSCTLSTFPLTLTVVPGNEEYQGTVGNPLVAGAAGAGKPGSVLSFLYTSSENGDFAAEDTRITITNQHLSLQAYLHVFLVTAAGGAADMFICLPPQFSTTLRASEQDPTVRGRLLVVAVDATGAPTSFNYLTGEEDLWLASGHAANKLKALSYQALSPEGSSLPPNEQGFATINLDGVSYSKAAQTLKLQDVPNPADGNDTLLFVLPASLSESGSGFIGGIKGMLYEKKTPGTFYPFSNPGGTYLFSSLSDSFPATTPVFSQLLAGGKDWQMIFYPTNEQGGMTGLWLNRNAAKPSANKADWLRPQALTSAGKIVVPVFLPACF